MGGDVAVSPDGSRVYVTDVAGYTVTVIALVTVTGDAGSSDS
jgi:DNA-binding beta-propeller fold protein YncE